MDQQDIEEIIIEWLEDWRNLLEDLSDLEEDLGTKQEKEKELDKGKEKMGEPKKKSHVGEKRKVPKEETTPGKKFKWKADKPPPLANKLSEGDIDNISLHVHESMEELVSAIMASQNVIEAVIDQRIMELKTLLERAPQMSIAPTTQSTSKTPWDDSMFEGRTQFIRILLTSIRLPLGSTIEQIGFIEVNLADISTETL